jgi:hypothetical protein
MDMLVISAATVFSGECELRRLGGGQRHVAVAQSSQGTQCALDKSRLGNEWAPLDLIYVSILNEISLLLFTSVSHSSCSVSNEDWYKLATDP